ncbi:MAG: hypothetical protein QXZ17_15745 [Nitrososphaerota archaeon]
MTEKVSIEGNGTVTWISTSGLTSAGQLVDVTASAYSLSYDSTFPIRIYFSPFLQRKNYENAVFGNEFATPRSKFRKALSRSMREDDEILRELAKM